MKNEISALFSEKLTLGRAYAETFKNLASKKLIDKNNFLISEGTVCDFVGIVDSGSMRSFVRNDEEEFNNDFYFEDDFVSAYNSFLTRRSNGCNIQALTDTAVYCLSYQQLHALLEEDKEWMKFGKYVSDFFYIKKCERETSLLRNSAAERFNLLLENFPGIEQKVSQYHIASYLGIKPETLSRLKAAKISKR